MTAATLPRGWALLFGTIAISIGVHFIHEVFHMLAAISFGVSGTFGLNTVRYADELSDTAYLIITFAGPAVTLVIGAIALAKKSRWSSSVLFVVAYQRALAALLSALGAPNDEARMGLILGIGQWPIFALTIGTALAMLAWQLRGDWHRRSRLGWLGWLGIAYLATNIAVTIMVFADTVLPRIPF